MLLIVTTVVSYNYWMLDPRTFFYADDWQWLSRAHFVPWSDYTLLPVAVYNDRPVGAAFLKVLFLAFGADHRAFQIAQLSLHAVNCSMLYFLAVPYAGRLGAIVAALLSAVWASANIAVHWSAAIFDLLGATMCLVTLLIHQRSLKSQTPLPYNLAGAVCYFLAIRTKEFALALIVLLFLMDVLLGRRSIRASLRQLAPYAVVFAIFAGRHAQLMAEAPSDPSDPYQLKLSILGVLQNLGFYVATLTYSVDAPAFLLAACVAALGLGMLQSNPMGKRLGLFGLIAFFVLLAPTLLLPARLDALYLYAPHFFAALAIASLFCKPVIGPAIAGALAIAIVALPTWTKQREHIPNFYFLRGETNRAQLLSAVDALAALPPLATVVISGVEPVFNPFWTQPGNALKLALNDQTIRVVVEKSESELVDEFCRANAPRRYLRFSGVKADDVSAEMEGRCGSGR
jgi:hypothetical protein